MQVGHMFGGYGRLWGLILNGPVRCASRDRHAGVQGSAPGGPLSELRLTSYLRPRVLRRGRHTDIANLDRAEPSGPTSWSSWRHWDATRVQSARARMRHRLPDGRPDPRNDAATRDQAGRLPFRRNVQGHDDSAGARRAVSGASSTFSSPARLGVMSSGISARATGAVWQAIT